MIQNIYKELNKKIKINYNNLNSDNKYILKISCKQSNDNKYRYYFKIIKNNENICTKRIVTNECTLVHSFIYNIILELAKNNSFDYITINDSLENGKCNIYFKNNFIINASFDNEIDKIFFDNVFYNYRHDLDELKLRKRIS